MPFEGTSPPGYLFRPPGLVTARPTLIYHGGYDSVLEEAYFATGAAAARRGYTCIAFHGHGQGAVLRDQGLTFRPDWETVVGEVIDAALQRPDVDPQRVALMGTSPGGFLAARAAAFEHRLAALIVHDAIFDTRSGLRSLPPRRVSKRSTATHSGRYVSLAIAIRGPSSTISEQLAAVVGGAAPSQRHSRAGSAPAPQLRHPVPHIRSGSLTETPLTWSQRPLIAECYARAPTLKPTGSVGIHSRRSA